jgi:hypothetical protein
VAIHKRTVEAAKFAAERISRETKFKESEKTWDVEKPRASAGIEIKPSEIGAKHDLTITCSYKPEVGCFVHGVSEGLYADTAHVLRREIKKIEGCDIAESADIAAREYVIYRPKEGKKPALAIRKKHELRMGMTGITETYYACRSKTPEDAIETAVNVAKALEKTEKSEKERIARIKRYVETKWPGTPLLIARQRSRIFRRALIELMTTKEVTTLRGPRRIWYPKTPRDIEAKILKYMKYE